jgi:hypothetical protein
MALRWLTIALLSAFHIVIARGVAAETFQITWQTVGGGAGASGGGSFMLAGTVGQPEATTAGALAGGSWSLTGGYWSVSLPLCSTFTEADVNQDCLVDNADVEAFKNCAAGANVPMSPQCQAVDLDHDGDGDMDDFAILQRCFRGANQPASPTCGN